jgi:hypothetical protein
VLSDFINGFDLAALTPDRDSVVRSPGVVPSCLSARGKAYALYLRGRGPTELTLRLPGGMYRAEWLDVVTGKVLKGETVTPGADGEATLASPDFDEEIALRVLRQ